MIFPRILEKVFIGGEYNISNNGIGSLPDCLSCIVTEERNGRFVLQMTYPVGGFNWKEIKAGRYIVCKPNRTDTEQPFRIVSVNRVAGGNVAVTAEHISYDMARILTEGFNAINSIAFLQNVNSRSFDSVGNLPVFTVHSDIVESGVYRYDRTAPRTMKSVLMDSEDSFLSLYGGEMRYAGLDVAILKERGKNRGFQLSVKNLLSLTETFSIRDYATAFYPFWIGSGEVTDIIVTLPEKVLHLATAEYSDVEKLEPLDLSEFFETAPMPDELRAKATEWINKHWNTKIPHNISVSCKIGKNDDVRLCDIVAVRYPEFLIYENMKVVEYNYNVLTDECESVKIGDPMPSFESTIFKIARREKN